MKKIISLAVMLFSSVSLASVSVYDHAGVLTQAEQSALIAEGSRWPFDLHVLTDTFPNPATLDSAVHRCVNGPNVVCIGIDPTHHKTNVHVGTGVGIPSSDFQSIAAAGNSNFRMHDYQGGIEAIASRAREVAHTITTPSLIVNGKSVPVATYGQPVQVHIDNTNTGMSTGWWVFLILMLVFVGIGAWILRRAYKTAKKVNEDMNDFRDEAFEMSSRNLEERDFHEKLKTKIDTTPKPMMPATTMPALDPAQIKVVVQQVPVAPAPAQMGTTVVHNHYGNPGYNSGYNNTLTGSVVGDVLLANELTRPTPVIAPSPVIVEREVVHETVVPVDNGGGSSSWGSNSSDNDSGGSSSSWGSSDDSSSSDSGSSWDSGSGGDSGGGDSGW